MNRPNVHSETTTFYGQRHNVKNIDISYPNLSRWQLSNHRYKSLSICKCASQSQCGAFEFQKYDVSSFKRLKMVWCDLPSPIDCKRFCCVCCSNRQWSWSMYIMKYPWKYVVYIESIYFGFGGGVGLGEYCSVCLITGSDATVGCRPHRCHVPLPYRSHQCRYSQRYLCDAKRGR